MCSTVGVRPRVLRLAGAGRRPHFRPWQQGTPRPARHQHRQLKHHREAGPSADQLQAGRAPQPRLAEGPNFQVAVPAVRLPVLQRDLAGAQQAPWALGPARQRSLIKTGNAAGCGQIRHQRVHRQLLTWKAANPSLPAESAVMLACPRGGAPG